MSLRVLQSTWSRTLPAAVVAGICAWGSLLFAAVMFTPSDQPTGWIAQPEVSDYNLTSGAETVFQGDYEREFWSGNLFAYPIDANGVVDRAGERWTGGAGAQIDQQHYDTGRLIVTMKADGTRIPFRWSSLAGSQQSSIGDNTLGPRILNYVRGDRGNEAPNGSMFRVRASALGDIVHSRPFYVDSATHPMVYVGANDGMLHAIDASTGREVYAYVPSMLIGRLKQLAPVAPTAYAHTWLVDGTPNGGEVTIGGATRRILVGGLGAGGKGMYAIDITDDAAGVPASEVAAAGKILWEITSTTINNNNSSSYSKLGYTYGTPLVVKTNSGGQSAVIAANGYLNSGGGTAVLYIIDAATGALIRAIDTGSGSSGNPNGLSSPTGVDSNGDGRVDYVYAGDLDGQLWKFDLSASAPSAWSASLLFTTSPVQSIVNAPAVAAHPYGGVMVAFGTGRAFSSADLADTAVHYVYGIRDGAPSGVTTLLGQTLTEASYAGPSGAVRVRTSTANAANWTAHRGWKVGLPAGERVVGEGAFIANGRFYFTSWNPTVNTSVQPSGENWLHELDHLTGGAKNVPFLDLNGDHLLNDLDRVRDAAGNPIAGPAGVPMAKMIGPGVQSQPILVQLDTLDTTLFSQNPDVLFPPVVTSTEPGVAGGHFDVDIYYGNCVLKKGVPSCTWGSKQHVHEYDNKYDVTGVDMLNASNTAFNLVNAIADPGTPFRVLVMNQYLNPGVTLDVGGAGHVSVKSYGGLASTTDPWTVMAGLPVYSRNSISTLEFNMPVDAFTAKDWWGNGDVRVGLHPTSTGCVKTMNAQNLDPTPGIQGERHNGALTIQIIKDTTPGSALELNVAGKPEYGWRVKQDAAWVNYVLAEYTVFWHANIGCYVAGNSKWTKSPPPEPPSNNRRGVTRAPGSDDPRSGVLPPTSPVQSATTTVTGNVTTTLTLYANGTSMLVTRTANADGTITVRTVNVDGTVRERIVADPRGTLIVGADESRLQARTGRVSWQERLRP